MKIYYPQYCYDCRCAFVSDKIHARCWSCNFKNTINCFREKYGATRLFVKIFAFLVKVFPKCNNRRTHSCGFWQSFFTDGLFVLSQSHNAIGLNSFFDKIRTNFFYNCGGFLMVCSVYRHYLSTTKSAYAVVYSFFCSNITSKIRLNKLKNFAIIHADLYSARISRAIGILAFSHCVCRFFNAYVGFPIYNPCYIRICFFFSHKNIINTL